MKKKQVVSGLLATVMIANIALVDMGPVQAAENLNLAKGCNVTASSYEVSDQIDTSPAKAVDGDMATRWGTAQNKADNEWIEIDLDGEKTVRQININFERTDEAQNILSYKIELEENGKYTEVYKKTAKAKQKGSQHHGKAGDGHRQARAGYHFGEYQGLPEGVHADRFGLQPVH